MQFSTIDTMIISENKLLELAERLGRRLRQEARGREEEGGGGEEAVWLPEVGSLRGVRLGPLGRSLRPLQVLLSFTSSHMSHKYCLKS